MQNNSNQTPEDNLKTTHRQTHTNTVCAVIVTFFPDLGLEERIQVLLPQIGTLVIVDNTPAEECSPRFASLKDNNPRIYVIENHKNLGIAAALNQGLNFAIESGHKWILTLDQDTQCYSDMVSTLLDVYKICKPKPAVIGSNYYDSQNNRLKVPAGEAGEYLVKKTVITSGSLIDANLAQAIGGFREDYFIDQVDHEFCLRARTHGYWVVITRKPAMAHSVGNTGGVRVPFLGALPKHPPLRKYYIARNTVITVSTYWRQEPRWCLRRFARLMLGLGHMAILEENRIAKVRAFVAGVADGLLHRLGPCRRKWLFRTN